MHSLRLVHVFCALALAACVDGSTDDSMAEEIELAGSDALPPADAADGSADWDVGPTLQVGTRVFDGAGAGGRRIHPMWIAGTREAPVPVRVTARAFEANDSVRVAVLGPLKDGQREVLAAAGYSARVSEVEFSVDVKVSGEVLIVVGSFGLATDVTYELSATCAPGAGEACGGARVDVLASPKAGALVGTESGRLVQATLGDVLAERTTDIEVELWASPPMVPWVAERVAVSQASGNQVNFIVPAGVDAGDDLTMVVREAGGRVLETGFVTRFAPEARSFARTDAILYGDIASLQIAGVAGFFEGAADLELRSETRGLTVAAYTAWAEQPGADGIGFGAFDASFTPELEIDGELNPALPRNGELLSVGTINGNGDYRPLACFEYCNDLSGMETCTGGPRTCPAAD